MTAEPTTTSPKPAKAGPRSPASKSDIGKLAKDIEKIKAAESKAAKKFEKHIKNLEAKAKKADAAGLKRILASIEKSSRKESRRVEDSFNFAINDLEAKFADSNGATEATIKQLAEGLTVARDQFVSGNAELLKRLDTAPAINISQAVKAEVEALGTRLEANLTALTSGIAMTLQQGIQGTQDQIRTRDDAHARAIQAVADAKQAPFDPGVRSIRRNMSGWGLLGVAIALVFGFYLYQFHYLERGKQAEAFAEMGGKIDGIKQIVKDTGVVVTRHIDKKAKTAEDVAKVRQDELAAEMAALSTKADNQSEQLKGLISTSAANTAMADNVHKRLGAVEEELKRRKAETPVPVQDRPAVTADVSPAKAPSEPVYTGKMRFDGDRYIEVRPADVCLKRPGVYSRWFCEDDVDLDKVSLPNGPENILVAMDFGGFFSYPERRKDISRPVKEFLREVVINGKTELRFAFPVDARRIRFHLLAPRADGQPGVVRFSK